MLSHPPLQRAPPPPVGPPLLLVPSSQLLLNLFLCLHSTAVALIYQYLSCSLRPHPSYCCQRDLLKYQDGIHLRPFPNAQAFCLHLTFAHTPRPQTPCPEQEWQMSGTCMALLCPDAMTAFLADHSLGTFSSHPPNQPQPVTFGTKAISSCHTCPNFFLL